MVRRSWRTELKSATTQKDVLGVVMRFQAEWPAAEIAQLPRGTWPSRAVTRADVLSHAAVLGALHSHFEGPAAALPGLQEMLLFFTHAAVRLVQLGDAGARLSDPASGETPATEPVPRVLVRR
jgi:hypothetical protein